MDERRRQYRTVPVYEGQITVIVARSEECGVRSRVVDLSVGGVALDFEAESDPGLEVGEVLYLYIDSPYLDEPIVTLGKVERSDSEDGERHYGLRIIDWLGLLTQLPAELKALFNQRSEYRVGVGPNHPIQITGITKNFHVDGLLHDLTPHGLCFQVALEAKGTFMIGHVVRVTFALPGDEEELSFPGRIRHAEWAGDRLYCGVCFDEDESEEESFQAQRQKIADYVSEVVRKARDVSSP